LQPTYKEKDIPALVKKICKEEYDFRVVTRRIGNTLWVYIPMPSLLHKDYGRKKDKILDEAVTEKLRNILTSISRVLLSADKSPAFFCIVASDTRSIGLDYTLIGYSLDMKKSFAGFIPWTEANRRYVVKFNLNPAALGDEQGRHLKFYDIKFPDFLAQQIAQRINLHFQSEKLKDYFKVDSVKGRFKKGDFVFEYSIKKTKEMKKTPDINKEIIRIIIYCLKTYNFSDFLLAELNDTAGANRTTFSKSSLLSMGSGSEY
jgi:hypothetical protein